MYWANPTFCRGAQEANYSYTCLGYLSSVTKYKTNPLVVSLPKEPRHVILLLAIATAAVILADDNAANRANVNAPSEVETQSHSGFKSLFYVAFLWLWLLLMLLLLLLLLLLRRHTTLKTQ
jgi:hypothetical protein